MECMTEHNEKVRFDFEDSIVTITEIIKDMAVEIKKTKV